MIILHILCKCCQILPEILRKIFKSTLIKLNMPMLDPWDKIGEKLTYNATTIFSILLIELEIGRHADVMANVNDCQREASCVIIYN
jgi:hypothetical protein